MRVRLRLPGTVWAGEACLVGMGHEVIVEAVLPGEGGLTDPAFKRSQTRVAPIRKCAVQILCAKQCYGSGFNQVRRSRFNQVRKSGSRSRRAKITHKI